MLMFTPDELREFFLSAFRAGQAQARPWEPHARKEDLLSATLVSSGFEAICADRIARDAFRDLEEETEK